MRIRSLYFPLSQATRRPFYVWFVCLFGLLALYLPALWGQASGQTAAPPTGASPAGGRTIHGLVKSGYMPIPGATVSGSEYGLWANNSIPGPMLMEPIDWRFQPTDVTPCGCRCRPLPRAPRTLCSMPPIRACKPTLNWFFFLGPMNRTTSHSARTPAEADAARRTSRCFRVQAGRTLRLDP